jgi:hypothetical protein
MNESTLTQLKIVVERAVRPVRASTSRKRKMREELLGHVSGVFEEEFAKLRDERLALERTAQRFGQSGELTEQLQATVPASDVIDRLFAGQPGESTLRAATRLAAWNLALGVIVFIAATFLSGFGTVWPREAILFTVFSILFLPVFMFLLTFATELIRQAWYEPARRSRLRAALLTFGWFTIIMISIEGLTWLNGIRSVYGDNIDRIWITLWLAASIPWMPWCLAHVADARIRYQREWASLRID